MFFATFHAQYATRVFLWTGRQSNAGLTQWDNHLHSYLQPIVNHQLTSINLTSIVGTVAGSQGTPEGPHAGTWSACKLQIEGPEPAAGFNPRTFLLWGEGAHHHTSMSGNKKGPILNLFCDSHRTGLWLPFLVGCFSGKSGLGYVAHLCRLSSEAMNHTCQILSPSSHSVIHCIHTVRTCCLSALLFCTNFLGMKQKLFKQTHNQKVEG